MGIATAKRIYHFIGLSTDTKPVPDDIGTGSTFTETDTGVYFVYNNTKREWIATDVDGSSEQDEVIVPATCIGIKKIVKNDPTWSEGKLIDSYTIIYTNGATFDFQVINGTQIRINKDIINPIANKLYTITVQTGPTNSTTYDINKFVELSATWNSEDKAIYTDETTIFFTTSENKFIATFKDDTLPESFGSLKSIEFVYIGSAELDSTNLVGSTWQATILGTNSELIRFTGTFISVNTNKYRFIAKEVDDLTITGDILGNESGLSQLGNENQAFKDIYLSNAIKDLRSDKKGFYELKMPHKTGNSAETIATISDIEGSEGKTEEEIQEIRDSLATKADVDQMIKDVFKI